MVEDAGHLAPFSRRRIAVIRRCRTSLALASLAAIGIAGVADRAQASGLATYSFTNTSSGSITQVVAEIQPAGAVAPPTANVSPLTILPGSSGFDSTQLIDSLGSGKLANGNPLQVLELQFNGGGLKPGGTINFGLSLASNFTGPSPSLMIDSPTTGIQQLPFTPPTTTGGDGSGSGSGSQSGGGSTGVTNAIPEPISLTLWSVAAGLGLLRARVFRRARQIEG
jgi:hypothetical protein